MDSNDGQVSAKVHGDPAQWRLCEQTAEAKRLRAGGLDRNDVVRSVTEAQATVTDKRLIVPRSRFRGPVRQSCIRLWQSVLTSLLATFERSCHERAESAR